MGARLGRAVAVVLAVLAAGTPSVSASPADCRRVPLTDAATGAPVVGPEDLAFHAPSGTLFISAFDRVADSGGGLYALPLNRLESGVAARVDGGVVSFPHGIGLGDGRLAVIDHDRGADGGRQSRLVVFAVAPSGAIRDEGVIADPRLTRGNDVAPDGQGGWLVTVDRGSETGLGRALEVMLPLSRAMVIRPGVAEPFAGGLTFANGIGLLPDGRIVVAETRAARLTVLAPDGTVAATRPLEAPPDNIAPLPDGRVAVALLTGGVRLMLSRHGWFGLEPPGSRVIAVDPAGKAPPRVLFDDPEGRVLKAATSAVAAGNRLVVGSVADAALVVCAY